MEPLTALTATICEAGGRKPIVLTADFAQKDGSRLLAQQVLAKVERVDALVNNAGGSRPLDRPDDDVAWNEALILNFLAANAAIAAQDWPRALEDLQRAGALAEAMKLGRMRIEIMALRAYALDRNADDGRPLLEEAMNLAETYGLTRLFVDAHPALGDWARRTAAGKGETAAARRPIPPPRRPAASAEREAGALRAVSSMVLTPKEREILELPRPQPLEQGDCACQGSG